MHYDPETGFFVWLLPPRKKSADGFAGKQRKDGYRLISVDGDSYLAHRLAWLYVYGVWPALMIDHRNRCRSDNRIENLREADSVLNSLNRGVSACRSTSGVLGVRKAKAKGRFAAQINVRGDWRHLGTFDSVEEAGRVYEAAKRQIEPHIG